MYRLLHGGYYEPKADGLTLTGKWGFRFVESIPAVSAAPDSVTLGSWTELPVAEVKNTMGTALIHSNLT